LPAVTLRLGIARAFVVCFAVWLMFGVIGIPIKNELGLNGLEFGLLTSTPVLTGALFRLPLGIWTGGRIVMFALLVGCAIPVWLSSYADQLWQFLLLGLALGAVGASFAVGTPYVARFFAQERRGLAMGVFGAGTTGAAINMFIAPTLMVHHGRQSVPRFYAVTLLITALIFWLLSAPDVSAPGKKWCFVAPAIGCSQRHASLEVLPVLLDRIRRLHSAVGMDAAILCTGI
jgi:NNP family nitrate/nitrite transporter-like MFS transporter